MYGIVVDSRLRGNVQTVGACWLNRQAGDLAYSVASVPETEVCEADGGAVRVGAMVDGAVYEADGVQADLH